MDSIERMVTTCDAMVIGRSEVDCPILADTVQRCLAGIAYAMNNRAKNIVWC